MRSLTAVLTTLLFTCGVALAQVDLNSSGTGMSTTTTRQGGATGGAGTEMSTSTQQGGATGGAMTGEEKQITGEVMNVNKDQKKITITGPKGNKAEYTLNNNTEITTRTGEKMTIGDLKSGSKVTITYTGTGANAKATKVEVMPGK